MIIASGIGLYFRDRSQIHSLPYSTFPHLLSMIYCDDNRIIPGVNFPPKRISLQLILNAAPDMLVR